MVTGAIIEQVPEIKTINIGLFHVFIQHTSASLTINENADPSIRQDFESFFNHNVAENHAFYAHTEEGTDDMPAHLKTSILGNNLTIPIGQGSLQ